MGTWPHIEAFLAAHGATLILPLSIVEGPLVAVICGVLCARADLASPLTLGLLVCGDLIGDFCFYGFGRLTFGPLKRLGGRFRVSSEKSAALGLRLQRDSVRLLLIGKWTHAVGAIVLIGAGMARMPIWKFFAVNFFATIPKVGLLFAVGYGFADLHRRAPTDWFAATVALFALGAGSIYLLLRRSDPLGANLRGQDAPGR